MTKQVLSVFRTIRCTVQLPCRQRWQSKSSNGVFRTRQSPVQLPYRQRWQSKSSVFSEQYDVPYNFPVDKGDKASPQTVFSDQNKVLCNSTVDKGDKAKIWNRTRPKAPVQNKQTRELISARNTQHSTTSKPRVAYGNSPGMRVNTRYISSTRGTSSTHSSGAVWKSR